MATTTVGNRLGGGDATFRKGLFSGSTAGAETVGFSTNGGGNGYRVGAGNNNGGGVLRTPKGLGDNNREDRRRELSGDEIEEADDVILPNKRVKVTDEVVEVSANFYGQIVAMLEGFGTKGTVWYNSPEAEKKRDKSAFVLWKGRTKPDGTMALSIMEQNRTVREVIATEVSIAQQFKDIFDPNSASRIFELVSNGSNIQKAVFQTLSEQNDNGSD
jgi:hypothetical protein